METRYLIFLSPSSLLSSLQFYSASFTGDMRLVVEYVRKARPNSPLLAAGWSLGANIMMRYLGEQVRKELLLSLSSLSGLPNCQYLQSFQWDDSQADMDRIANPCNLNQPLSPLILLLDFTIRSSFLARGVAPLVAFLSMCNPCNFPPASSHS